MLPQNRMPSGCMWEYYQKDALDLQKELIKRQGDANIEIQKRKAVSEIDIDKAEKIAKVRADTALKKEMQTAILAFGGDGDVTVCQKMFSGDAKGRLNVGLVESATYEPAEGGDREKVLYVRFRKKNGAVVDLYFCVQAATPKRVADKFAKYGISFGLKYKKEQEWLWKMFLGLLANAQICKIPIKHGWMNFQGQFTYVYPGDLVWEEVRKNAT